MKKIACLASLSAMKKDIADTVIFIFQPAEQGAPGGEEGGAALIVKEVVINTPKVDVVFGMHIESWIPVADLQYKSGSFMASVDLFISKLKDNSSHRSQPWLADNPILLSEEN